MQPMLDLLQDIARNPGSRVGEFINNLNVAIVKVAVALFALVLLATLLEGACALVVDFRARRAKKRDQKKQPRELLRFVPPWAFVARRVRHLSNQQLAQPSILEMMSTADADSAESRLAIPRFLVGVPVLLGLCGTLVGLTIAITEIQPLITGIDDFKDLPSLLSAMVQTLTGMKTAFATSIVGIVSSLALSGIGTLVAWLSSSTLNYLDRTMMTNVLPVVTPHWESAALVFSEALETGTETLKQAIASLQPVVTGFEEASDKSLQASVGFGAATGAFQESVSQFGDSKKSTDVVFGRMNTALEGVASAADKIHGSLGGLQTQEQAHADRERVAKALNQVTEGVGKVVERVDQIAQGSPEIFADTLSKVRDESKKDLVHLLDSIETGVESSLNGLRTSVQQLLEAIETSHAKLQAIAVQQHQVGVTSIPPASATVAQRGRNSHTAEVR